MDPKYFVVDENNGQVLYVYIINTLYGLMISVLFYNKLKMTKSKMDSS